MSSIPDERLALLFTCCHPALGMEARVALTLREVGGLATPEIARAFLVPEPTLAQRLVRAKPHPRDGDPVPRAAGPSPPGTAPGRSPRALPRVQRGLRGHGRHLARPGQLCADAIRLTKLLCVLMPDEPEALGLLALLLLQDSRRAARISPEEARPARRPGPRALGRGLDRRGAARAAPSGGDASARPIPVAGGDRRRTCRGRRRDYDRCRLRRARAARPVSGRTPEPRRRRCARRRRDPRARAPRGDRRPGGYSYLPAARADLLRRLGRPDEAAASYREALGLTGNVAERRFLERRLREVAGTTG